jgi:hypothetical protein
MLITIFAVADIMSKFSACFDAKAAKDAKGKGKANPPSSLSASGTKTIPGPTDAATVLPALGTKGSLGGKAPVVSGVHKGGETRQKKRPRVLQGRVCWYCAFSDLT